MGCHGFLRCLHPGTLAPWHALASQRPGAAVPIVDANVRKRAPGPSFALPKRPIRHTKELLLRPPGVWARQPLLSRSGSRCSHKEEGPRFDGSRRSVPLPESPTSWSAIPRNPGQRDHTNMVTSDGWEGGGMLVLPSGAALISFLNVGTRPSRNRVSYTPRYTPPFPSLLAIPRAPATRGVGGRGVWAKMQRPKELGRGNIGREDPKGRGRTKGAAEAVPTAGDSSLSLFLSPHNRPPLLLPTATMLPLPVCLNCHRAPVLRHI